MRRTCGYGLCEAAPAFQVLAHRFGQWQLSGLLCLNHTNKYCRLESRRGAPLRILGLYTGSIYKYEQGGQQAWITIVQEDSPLSV